MLKIKLIISKTDNLTLRSFNLLKMLLFFQKSAAEKSNIVLQFGQIKWSLRCYENIVEN